MVARPGGPAAKREPSPEPGFSCHAALDEAARAPFSKERRMEFAKATKFHRKSGEGLGFNSPGDRSAVGAAQNIASIGKQLRSGVCCLPKFPTSLGSIE